jgi:hypothetical protein
MSSAALLYCSGGYPGIVSYFGVHGMAKEIASVPKMDEVVCAHNFFTRKGAKPILQATVHSAIVLLVESAESLLPSDCLATRGTLNGQ